MRKLRFIIFLLIGIVAVSSCASVKTKVYSKNEISKINGWLLEFTYESGSVEEINKTSGEGEIKIVKSGQLPTDLELRDDLFYMLKDDYSIPITKIATNETGKILIHPIHFRRSGGFKLLTVVLTNKSGDTLARIKIKNGDRNATYKDEEQFTSYAARTIANAIRKK